MGCTELNEYPAKGKIFDPACLQLEWAIIFSMNSTQCYFAGVEIHISRGEDQSGPFTLEQVQDYLAQGVLLPDDLAWHEGLDGWIPLSELAGSPSVAPALPQSPIQSEPAIAIHPQGQVAKKSS